MSIHNTVPIQMYVRDLLTKKPSRSLRAFKETALNFFFNFFLLATSQKIIFAISLTAKNWTEIEKLRMRTWKLNTEFFKTVMWRFHGKRWDCTVTAAWQWTIKKENRHSFPAEKEEKKVTGELSLVVTENTVFLFPVLSFSSWTPTRTSKHELTRESYQHWVLLHQELLWRNTAHHKTLYLTYLQETRN